MSYVVVAPDKFKGSLTAAQVAEHVAIGMRRARPELQIRELPMADGGEGTVDAALAAGGREHTLQVTGPMGEVVTARYATDAEGTTAVVELAMASGLAMTDADDEAARRSGSRGTGEMIAAAIDAGARTVVVGVGGSACTDGGAGLLTALGARLLDADGAELPSGGDALRHLDRVDLTGLDPRLGEVEIVLAADVENPLLGPDGAAAVYGPQKGADDAAVADLEAGLTRWVEALADAGVPQARDAATRPGAGAAGGVGYAALAVLGARQRPGVQVVLELTRFAEVARGADLVVTGEGSLDSQSLFGKTPVGVAAAARDLGVPTVAIAGHTTLSPQDLAEHGIVARYALTEIEPDVSVCLAEAGRLVEDVAQRLAATHL